MDDEPDDGVIIEGDIDRLILNIENGKAHDQWLYLCKQSKIKIEAWYVNAVAAFWRGDNTAT